MTSIFQSLRKPGKSTIPGRATHREDTLYDHSGKRSGSWRPPCCRSAKSNPFFTKSAGSSKCVLRLLARECA